MNLYGVLAGLLFFPALDAVPIDNGVEGIPVITCGPTSIGVGFATKNTFEGHLFVKGRYTDEECHIVADGTIPSAAIELPFGGCGVRRERSANPRGVFVSVTVVISFHPKFITKIDRALHLQCFYMEADKTVDTLLEVSMITTDAFTQNVPMPVCRYEVRSEGPTGDIISFAEVGQQVYHKWTCDTETLNTFCMLVHSCFVGDTVDRRVSLLDENGCARDKFVLGNLEYVSDLMAGREVHVYKFPDTSDVFFDCQIRITVKDPDVPCEDTRPPCGDPVRGKRSVSDTCAQGACVDVSTGFQSSDRLLQNSSRGYAEERALLRRDQRGLFGIDWAADVCLSWAHLGSALGGLVMLCVILSTAILVAVFRRAKRPVVLVFHNSRI